MSLRPVHALAPCILSCLGFGPLAGCDAPAPSLDAGLVADAPAPRPDGGPPPPPYACDGEVTMLDGVLGDTASIDLDISMTPERPPPTPLA